MPVVDATALMDENGSSTSIFICNRDANSAQKIDLLIEGFELEKDAELMMIHCDDLALRNSLDQPDKIAPVFDKISVQGNRIKYSMPPLSLVRIVVKSK